MKTELSQRVYQILDALLASPRLNESISDGANYCQHAAIARGSAILVCANGRRWNDSKSVTFDELIELLKETPLDPLFEKYGNFVEPDPSDERGNLMLPSGWVLFHGNFYILSHNFQIASNDPHAIEELTAAIRANQRSEPYATAKLARQTARKFAADRERRSRGEQRRWIGRTATS